MADASTKDFLAYSLLAGGLPIRGFQDGEAISAAFTRDTFEMAVGNRGLGAYNKILDDSATVTVTLQENSDNNDLFSGFHVADRKTPGGILIIFGLLQSNGRLALAWTGRIKKRPDISISNGIDVRAWDIITTELIAFVGGTNATTIVTGAQAIDIANALPNIEAAS